MPKMLKGHPNPTGEDLRLGLDRVAFAESLGVAPDPWQERLLRSSSSRVLLNCSRQSGKSTTSAIIALHEALYFPDSLVLCLAPALRQSQELFAKISSLYRDLGRPVRPDSDRKLSLELENGSRILTLPGSERTLRGFSGVSLLVIDEASRVEDALYFAVRPMLAVSGGSLLMLSTPAGRRGVFYTEWRGGDGWERYEVPARDCPRITPEFLEEERKALPPPVFRAEYECSFEALDDQPFSDSMIASAFSDESVEPLFPGM